MLIIPAIDLYQGQCVRLSQGKEEERIVYSDDPVAMARTWESKGAPCLHVVDLEGAFRGTPVHSELIGRIAQDVSIPIEVGGGLRDVDTVRALLSQGAARAIVGTGAHHSVSFIRELVAVFGDRIAVGIDAKDGMVAVEGWTAATKRDARVMAREMQQNGVKTIIFTDIMSDGMLQGTNIGRIRNVLDAVDINVIASGGISSVKDIKELRSLNKKNLYGAIIGKALYSGALTLEEAIEAGSN